MPHRACARLPWLAILVLLPLLCRADATPQLAFDGRALSLDSAPLDTAGTTPSPPVPYRIFSTQPLVLTALLAGLEPAALVLRSDPASRGGLLCAVYPGHVPQALPDGGVALVSVPDALTGVSNGLSLFDPSGREYWRAMPGSQAQLLAPALDGPADAEQAERPLLVLRWQGGNAVFPYGTQPEVLRISRDGAGAVEEPLQLDLPHPAAGVELLASNARHGLLLAQYDFQSYEFIAISYAPLAVTGRWPLSGQPLTELIYPGPGYAYTALALTGSQASLAVFEGSLQGTLEVWNFDLAAGTLLPTAYLGELRDAGDAPNAADTAPGAVPYPQRILPHSGHSSWTIPAVQDGAGRTLVVHADGSVAFF